MSEEQGSDRLLVAFIDRILNLRDEIRERQGDVRDIGKEAKSAGFDKARIMDVVRRLEKIDKHGRDAVLEAEAINELYADAYDGGGQRIEEMFAAERDKALAAQFAGEGEVDSKITQRRKTMQRHIALARAANAAARK